MRVHTQRANPCFLGLNGDVHLRRSVQIVIIASVAGLLAPAVLIGTLTSQKVARVIRPPLHRLHRLWTAELARWK
jgi:hypothetical protein